MIRQNDGFSLMELMTVIGIIALVCGIALPAAVSWVPKYKQSSAARDVMAAFEKARMLAIKQNSYVLVELESNTVFVYLCNDNERKCTNNLIEASTDDLKTIYRYKLPSGMKLKEPANVYASLDLHNPEKRFTNISRPHFRFSREGYPKCVNREDKDGDLMRGSIAVSTGNTFEDKLVFISAGGNVKIKNPDPSDEELKNE